MHDSILTSVKKLLGIEEDFVQFDLDIMININAAISTLSQIGVGPKHGFIVTSKTDTFEDFLGYNNKLVSMVKMYLFYKTRLGFDPPTSSAVLECLKQMIQETEWRLNVEVDPEDTFNEYDKEVIE